MFILGTQVVPGGDEPLGVGTALPIRGSRSQDPLEQAGLQCVVGLMHVAAKAFGALVEGWFSCSLPASASSQS